MTDRSSERPLAAGSLDDRDADGWFDRLLLAVGLRNAPSIRGELEDALAKTAPSGEFSPKERTMLRNVLALRELRVDDAMVPRADIIAVPVDMSLGDVLSVFRTAGHSRLPVYDETLDDPRGMVHIRDFVDFLAGRAEAAPSQRPRRIGKAIASLGGIDLTLPLSATKILRPVLFVPPSMPALDLLVKMQAMRTHMALVIDEYGGTDGLVSIEDVVEMVVGDIEDEHDEAEGPMIANEDGAFVADARASLEEVSQAIGFDLAAAAIAEEIDTIGGLIVTIAGHVPARGELIKGPNGFQFEVLDADPRRLKRLRIYHGEPKPASRSRPSRDTAEPPVDAVPSDEGPRPPTEPSADRLS